ncbi:amidohydrolase family protein [Geothermobacter hydrogeniphilus]|uniref:Amidohydrolase n=1 Tax=Geothermobacter hydrogeniphilus TaxID=1969733 RepID=A0A1X0Y290_9BACT|nr:amidohydrolase family protein [Geothermobacter hydrogeniphilus]ORJ59256.1 amidohydrolase [Geothermobacter hydrogeniphilus]
MERVADQDIIDVHVHCFVGTGQAERIHRGLAGLRQAGVRQMAVMGLVNPDLDEREVWKLIPEGFDNLGDPLFNEADLLLELTRQSDRMLFPMLDTRMLHGQAQAGIEKLFRRGFRGIKGLYLPDNANDLGIAGIPETFGISPGQYREQEWEIFAFAEAHGLPVVYHMDAGRYGDVMRAIVDDFPRLRINFPHFGIGRRAFASILDRSPNVFTDIAYLRPHIRRNPASYADFIRHYPAQVCFGTDALLHQPGIILDYIDLVKSLNLPEELEHTVFSGNPRRFLGLNT